MNRMPENLPEPTALELDAFRLESPVSAITLYRRRTGVENTSGTINFWHWIREFFEARVRAGRPDVYENALLADFHGTHVWIDGMPRACRDLPRAPEHYP